MPLERIPVTFEHEGRNYTGYLTSVSGAASNTHFHLMIDHYYKGQLFYTPLYGWQMDGEFQELKDYFVDVLISWYQ
jgi:hypothetical protein